MTDTTLDKTLPIGPTHIERTPAQPWGTTKRQWAQSYRLGGKHIMPTVDDPTVEKHPKAATSPATKAPGFIPKHDPRAIGISGAGRDRGSTPEEIREYAQHPAHAVGILTRNIRALDFDFKLPSVIPDDFDIEGFQTLASEVFLTIRRKLPQGDKMPMRWRPSHEQMDVAKALGWVQGATTEMKAPDFNGDHADALKLPSSGSWVLLFRFKDDELADVMGEPAEPFNKEVMFTPAGQMEVQGDGSFQVLTGRHKSGLPQLWCVNGVHGFDLPTYDDIPAITRAEFADFMDFVRSAYPDPRNEERKHPAGDLPDSDMNPDDDPVVSYVLTSGMDKAFKKIRDGRWVCSCPNADNHHSPSGPTSTVYFPEGWNGKQRGFKCMHSECNEGRVTVAHYLKHIGYTEHRIVEAFEAETTPAPPPAVTASGTAVTPLRFSASGALEVTQYNVNTLLCNPTYCNIMFSNDTFTGNARYSIAAQPARSMHKATVNEVYNYLVAECGLPAKCSLTVIGDAITLALDMHSHSSAQAALGLLEWDKVKRLDMWLPKVLGEKATPYLRICGRYIMTAIVGRLLKPGLKVDITPIFYGPNGVRKSTLVRKLALNESWYDETAIDARDKDLMIKLMGKAVVELGELRGFASRDAEGIKAWLTAQSDNYRMPYDVFATDRPRQFVCIGTTNDYQFLNDRISLRRFAPIETPRQIDTEWVEANITQLYAEAKHAFLSDGLPWQELEKLAEPFCKAVSLRDPWEDAVDAWHKSEYGPAGTFSATEALQHAVGIRPYGHTPSNMARMSAVLRSCGAKLDPMNRWYFPSDDSDSDSVNDLSDIL